jgi:hypothetical protein
MSLSLLDTALFKEHGSMSLSLLDMSLLDMSLLDRLRGLCKRRLHFWATPSKHVGLASERSL